MNRRRRAAWLVVATTILGGGLSARGLLRAGHSDLVISQVYGGGGRSGAALKNDFIELFNRGDLTLTLDGLSVQYASANGSTWQRTNLTGTLAPGEHYLVQEAAGPSGTQALPPPDAVGTIAMGASGKVALVANQALLACGGAAGSCLPNPAILDLVGYGPAVDTFEGGRAPADPASTTAVVRRAGGCTDADDNGADFTTGAPQPRNRAAGATPCSVPRPPSGTAAGPASTGAGDAVLLTVAVTPGTHPVSTGLRVAVDLSPIGGPVTQELFDDGTNGDATAGDLVFSFRAVVGAGIPPGIKTLVATLRDDQVRGGAAILALEVQRPPMAIHDIQGPSRRSPFEGQSVRTTGIVTARRTNGFFLQSPDAEADADPNTSEGLFVFTGGPPPAAAAVGNAVSVSGRVVELSSASDPAGGSLTQIANAPVVSLLSVGHPLPAPVELTAADSDPAGETGPFERFEGMRVHVGSLTVVAPTEGRVDERNARATSTGVFYGVITGSPRRFEVDPERIRVESGPPGAGAIEVTAGAVLRDLVGPLGFGTGTYTLAPDPTRLPVVTGIGTAVPVPPRGRDELTVASLNLQRFFDDRDNPALREPVLTPFAYESRLRKASLAIRNVLRAPDVLGVAEVESRSVLETLARRISRDATASGQPDPGYRAYLIEGGDGSGLDLGVLVGRRVTVEDVTQEGREATFTRPEGGPEERVFDRPPLVVRAGVQGPGGRSMPLTVIVSHLRSLSGIDDPAEARGVRARRQAEAQFIASLVQARQAADSSEAIVLIGDFNAVSGSDGDVDVMATLEEPDLTDLVELLPAEERYSFSSDGRPLALDHVLVNRVLLGKTRGLHFARNDAGFPESFRNDPGRPERLSDHDSPVAYFRFPKADLEVLLTTAPDPVQSGSGLLYELTVTNEGPDEARQVALADTLPSGLAFEALVTPAGWSCGTVPLGSSGTLSCTTEALAPGETVTVHVSARAPCALADGSLLSNTGAVRAATPDPDADNNSANVVSAIVNPAPVVSSLTASRPVLWPANHGLVDVALSPSVSDNCDPNPRCQLAVGSNEPVEGTGDGDAAPDWVVIDAAHVKLRAEAAAGGPGRVYTLTLTCTDAGGASASRAIRVLVPPSGRAAGPPAAAPQSTLRR